MSEGFSKRRARIRSEILDRVLLPLRANSNVILDSETPPFPIVWARNFKFNTSPVLPKFLRVGGFRFAEHGQSRIPNSGHHVFQEAKVLR